LPPSSGEDAVALDQIHAIQIVSELCPSGGLPFWSYELNLVLDDGDRLNVVDHAGLPQIREDAETLAEWLGVPVWDATLVTNAHSP